MPAPRIDPRAVAAVTLGGCIGGPLRYAAGELAPAGSGEIPWAILAVNVAGSALLALLLAFVLEGAASLPYVREFVGIGILGTFTTFSTWMVQSQTLIDDGHPDRAAIYLGGSLLLGLIAAVAGLAIGRSIIASRRRM